MMSTTALPKKARMIALLILGAASLTALVQGAEPLVSPQTLGTAEATIEFCSSADAPRAEQYRAHAGLFLNGATEDQVSEVRKSPDYKSAYDATTVSFQQMNKDEALRTCKKLLQPAP